MRHVREILRLECAGISRHQIARLTGVVPSTVRETLKRFADSGLTWPLGDEITDTVLEVRMYKERREEAGASAICRAGLGLGASRAQAQARHAHDPLG